MISLHIVVRVFAHKIWYVPTNDFDTYTIKRYASTHNWVLVSFPLRRMYNIRVCDYFSETINCQFCVRK